MRARARHWIVALAMTMLLATGCGDDGESVSNRAEAPSADDGAKAAGSESQQAEPPSSDATAEDCERIPEDERPDMVMARGTGLDMDIYALRFEGSKLVQLTHEIGADARPAISPDGCSVAYVSEYVLHAVGSDGENERILAGGDEYGVDEPDWSPDGQSIFVQYGTPKGIELAIVDASGGDPEPIDVGGGEFFVSEPSWSADGEQIAFAGAPIEEIEGRVYSDIYVVDAEGGEPRQVTDTPIVIEQQIAWSPDGEWIAYTDTNARPRNTTGGGPFGERGVFAVSVDGGETRRLTTADDSFPTWAPDGSTIAYTHFEAHDRDRSSGALVLTPTHSVRTVSIEGDHGETLVEPDAPLFNLDWSPVATASVP
jgi:Tol biopolymer transport system component